MESPWIICSLFFLNQVSRNASFILEIKPKGTEYICSIKTVFKLKKKGD